MTSSWEPLKTFFETPPSLIFYMCRLLEIWAYSAIKQQMPPYLRTHFSPPPKQHKRSIVSDFDNTSVPQLQGLNHDNEKGDIRSWWWFAFYFLCCIRWVEEGNKAALVIWLAMRPCKNSLYNWELMSKTLNFQIPYIYPVGGYSRSDINGSMNKSMLWTVCWQRVSALKRATVWSWHTWMLAPFQLNLMLVWDPATHMKRHHIIFRRHIRSRQSLPRFWNLNNCAKPTSLSRHMTCLRFPIPTTPSPTERTKNGDCISGETGVWSRWRSWFDTLIPIRWGRED